MATATATFRLELRSRFTTINLVFEKWPSMQVTPLNISCGSPPEGGAIQYNIRWGMVGVSRRLFMKHGVTKGTIPKYEFLPLSLQFSSKSHSLQRKFHMERTFLNVFVDNRP